MTDSRPYTCEDVFRRLDSYLDRELTAEETRLVQTHLETCAQCAREHRFEATVLESLRHKLEHLQAPSSLVDRVAAILDRERHGGT